MKPVLRVAHNLRYLERHLIAKPQPCTMLMLSLETAENPGRRKPREVCEVTLETRRRTAQTIPGHLVLVRLFYAE